MTDDIIPIFIEGETIDFVPLNIENVIVWKMGK